MIYQINDILSIDYLYKNDLNDCPLISICGPKNSGKTTLIENIINSFNDINFEESTIIHYSYCQSYKENCPKTKILSTCFYVSESNIFDEINKSIDDTINSKNNKNKRIFIFDDILQHNKITCHPSFINLMNNHKEYNIILIISVQYPIIFLNNIVYKYDYLFIFNYSALLIEFDIKTIFKRYNINSFVDPTIFINLLQSFDRPGPAIVIKNQSILSYVNLKDNVFIYDQNIYHTIRYEYEYVNILPHELVIEI